MKRVGSSSGGRARRVIRMLGFVAVLLIAAAPAAHAASGFEAPPVVKAEDFAARDLLQAPGVRVDEQVETDGLTTRFVIHSDAGVFEAHGVETLRLRVAEVPALLELGRASKTKTFLSALGATAMKPIEGAAHMVTSPVETAKGIPSGLGRFFDRVGSGTERVVAAATDSSRSGGDRAADVAGATGRATADALGYEKELRTLAKRLGVDPYTTNPVLSEKLNEFARVAFAGHVGLNTLITVAVPVSAAISGTNITHDLVYDTSRGDLIVRNEERLRAMGVSDASLRALQRSPGFTLSVQTALVEALTRLGGVAGRPDVVALAATAETSDQALFLTRAAEMLATHHAKSPLASVSAAGTLLGRERGGRIVVAGPVDWVSWHERLQRFATREDLAGANREIFVSGHVTALARSELEALGWKVREGAALK